MQTQVPDDSRRYFIDTAQIRADEGVPAGNYEKDIWHEKKEIRGEKMETLLLLLAFAGIYYILWRKGWTA
jgi:hypothetical protein